MKTWADFGINVHGSGPECYTTCPQCSQTRKKKLAKCLSANLAEGVWVCHHCGWSGTLKEGAKDQPRYAHWHKPQYRKPESKPEVPGNDSMLKWFVERGISTEVVKRNHVVPMRVWMPQVEDYVTAIAFPFFRNGELINRKYRDRDKNFRLEAGCERVWYGLDDIATCDTAYIVEGECDKLAIETATGSLNCVSVPDGAPAPEAKNYSAKFDFLDGCVEATKHVKTWILAVDADEPGRVLEDELSRRLGREKCLRVRWPGGCKDANEVLQKLGAGAVSDALAAAEPYPIHGVFTALDFSEKVHQLYERGLTKGVLTGWSALDTYYTVRPGEMTVITGIPNSGKSNLADALIVNLALRYGWRSAICSPENYPTEEHIARLLEKWSGMPFDDGPTARLPRDDVQRGLRWIAEHFPFVLPDDEMTIEAVLERAQQLVFRHGIKGLLLDPWNEFEHKIPQGQNETQYICEMLTTIRQWARKHGVHVWIVVHPAKMYKDKDGNYPVPTLYDCAGSAHWRNKADNGMAVYRDFARTDGVIEIHVQKIRFRSVGKIGMCNLRYNRVVATYSEVNSDKQASWYQEADAR